MSIQVQCAVTNEPILIDDVAKADVVLDRTAIARLNIQAFVAVPLRSDKGPLGVMAADRSQSGRPVGIDDLETLQRFADQVTLALEIAHLHEEMVERERMDLELATAHKIQMSLMPSSSPEVEGFEIAGICEPASEVGGDYFTYEWLDAEKSQLGILAADVSGKGMQAAGITLRLNEMFFYETRTKRTPADILSGMHRSLQGRIESHMFATAYMVVLDVRTGKITMANAGHPYAYLCSGAGAVDKLPYEGLPIGMAVIPADTEYSDEELTLEMGQSLVLYSDGVIECRDPEEAFYEEERLETVLLGEGGGSAEELVQAIVRDVGSFRRNAPRFDDVTVVVIKRCS